MKILISNDGPCAFYYIRLGLARAFHACGHEVMIWDINQIPVLDVFDTFKPDLFLGQTYNTTRALCTAIKENPQTKVIMKAGDWGPLTDKIDSNKYGVLKASEKEKETILNLYQETGKPDFLHIYYPEKYIQQTHGYWMENGIPVYENMLAADIYDYTNGQSRPEFKSDITFIGGFWPYKAQVFYKYLIPLCNEFKYKIKIFGNSPWPVPQYCGYVQNELTKDILASATICIQLHEPHSQDFGFDISERIYKLLSNKCFVISDYVEGIEHVFGNKVILAKTPEDFWDKIDNFIRHPEDRLPYINTGFEEVIEKHTYFHRIINIFNRLNFKNHTQYCEHVYNSIKEKL